MAAAFLVLLSCNKPALHFCIVDLLCCCPRDCQLLHFCCVGLLPCSSCNILAVLYWQLPLGLLLSPVVLASGGNLVIMCCYLLFWSLQVTHTGFSCMQLSAMVFANSAQCIPVVSLQAAKVHIVLLGPELLKPNSCCPCCSCSLLPSLQHLL